MKITGFTDRPETWKLLHDICYDCGSNSLKKTNAYLRLAAFYGGKDKFYCDILEDYAFFAAIRNKTHVRLIGIAVRKEYQGNGIGLALLKYEIAKICSFGLHEMTFRTSVAENAINWWKNVGAHKVRREQGDWVMSLKF